MKLAEDAMDIYQMLQDIHVFL